MVKTLMFNHLHILFAPLLPASILAGLGIAAALASLIALLCRARGAWGRCGLFALLLLALANPSLIREQREPLKDTALLVIDDSASMTLGDRAAQVVHAAEALTKKLAAFPDLTLETLHVKGDDETDLFQALSTRLSALPADRLAGIIALTDGEIHDQPTGALPAPLHALIAGHKGEIDRRLIVSHNPAYGIVGKTIALTLRVEDQPKAQSATAPVTFHREDGTTATMNLPVGQDVPFDVTVTHAGKNLFAFDTPPLPNELTAINNSVAVTVNGIRDKLRVLLVSGEPHIGLRTWRNFLKADPAVDLVHFTILRSPGSENFVPEKDMALIAFPTRELFSDKLASFDLVIFDRFSNQSLMPDDYLNNIARYVDNGGALLISNATDDDATSMGSPALTRILPATLSGKILTGPFVPDITPTGQRHPVTAALTADQPRTTWGPWFRQAAADAPSGEVLMSGLNHQPLLVLGHVGQGRVAQFLSDQFWLWSKGLDKGGPQAELLRRVAHWLVQEPDLDESALRAHAERVDNQERLVITQQSLQGDSVAATVTDNDGKATKVTLVPGSTPGTLSATVPVAGAGLYHIASGDQHILVNVGATDAPEFTAMLATEDKLAPSAAASNGSISWLDDHADGPDIRRVGAHDATHGRGWIGLRHNGQYRVTGSAAYPLSPVWLALAILLAVLMLVWRREGR